MGFLIVDAHLTKEYDAAIAYSNIVISRLKDYAAVHGSYPKQIPHDILPIEDLPSTMRHDFYLQVDNGGAFLVRFQDPRWWYPKYWFNDIVGYQTNFAPDWERWDGY